MLARKLSEIKTRIRELEARYHREPQSVSLLAVSKGQSLENIQEVLAAGQYQFGENYLQEALLKMEALQHPQLEWHFIGTIQSNKTRPIARFSWVHTVCDAKIAARLNDQRPPSWPPLNICFEVNISHEPSKSGLTTLGEVIALARTCQSLPHLRLRGLMAIPAWRSSLAEQRAECRKLYDMQQALIQQGFELDTLSIGMTEDMEAAIAEGSTVVRVGKGIFGERPK